MGQKRGHQGEKMTFFFWAQNDVFEVSESEKRILSHFDTVLSHFCPHFDVKMPQKAPF